MAAYAQQDPSFISRRAIVLLAIVALHVFLIYALANGLARRVVEVIAPPIQADIQEKVEKRDEPPPPPPPPMERQAVEIPPPDVTIDIPVEAPPTAITQVTTQHVAPPPPAPKAVARVAPKLDIKRSPATDDFYPPPSRRAGEEGVTTIHACVTNDGKTSGTATVEKTSGFPRLDEAAIKWAARARWTPGTEDGKAIEACSQFNVRFKLTD